MSFKERLIETFGFNPFKCSKCNSEMILCEVWHHKCVTIYDASEKSNYVSTVDDDKGTEKIINCITKVKKLLKLNT